MPKGAGSPPTLENLRQVAGFLKQADKLVRERSYESALEQIAKARAKDPYNSYAEAYEQRVKILLAAVTADLKTKLQSENVDIPAAFSRHLENIANLAILNTQRSSGNVREQTRMEANEPEAESTQNKRTHFKPPVESAVAMLIKRAQDLEGKGQAKAALQEVAHAIELDPTTAKLHQLEQRLLAEISGAAAEGDGILATPSESDRNREIQCPERDAGYLEGRELIDTKRIDCPLLGLELPNGFDRLKDSVRRLEGEVKEIRDRQGELSLFVQAQDSEHRRVRKEETNALVDSLVREALRLACHGDYNAAVKLLSEGLSQDVSDSSPEAGENIMLTLLDEVTRIAGDRGMQGRLPVVAASDISPSVKNGEDSVLEEKRKTLAHLDKAESYLDDDRIGEALTEVSMAMLTFDLARDPMSFVPDHEAGYLTERDSSESPDCDEARNRKTGPQKYGRKFNIQFSDTKAGAVLQGTTHTEDRGRSSGSVSHRLCRILDSLVNARFDDALAEVQMVNASEQAVEDLRELEARITDLRQIPAIQPPVNDLHEKYDRTVEFLRNLILQYSYRNVIDGIDHTLTKSPSSEFLLKRREEAVLTLQHLKRVSGQNDHKEESRPGNDGSMGAKPKRSRARGINQIGMEFPDSQADDRLDGVFVSRHGSV